MSDGEADKNQMPKEPHQKLEELANSANAPLLVVRSQKWLDVQPMMLAIDRKKLTVTQSYWGMRQQITHVLIDDIKGINVIKGWNRSTVNIVDKNFPETIISVKNLKLEEAAAARRLIQGLIIAQREKIDVTQVPDKELTEKLMDMGRVRMG